jgi:hypothetical protein
MSRPARYLTPGRLAQVEGQLTHQDRLVVRTVAFLHLVSGDQLERTCFGEADSTGVASRARHARRRLAHLVELGLLARLARRVGGVRAGSAGFVYALAPAGQRLVADWHDEPRSRGRQPHEPSEHSAAHRLAVSEIYAGLVEADRHGRGRLLSFTTEPSCWRSFAGQWGSAQRLKPDASAAIKLETEELRWFIEADRGTVSRAALARQIDAYLAYWRSGHRHDPVMPRVLWLVPDLNRATTVKTIIAAGRAPTGLFVVGVIPAATDRLTDANAVTEGVS